MADPMDDEDNQSDVQGSIPRGVLAILAIALFLHVVWLAWLALQAMVPILMQAYIINKISICKISLEIIYHYSENTINIFFGHRN